jgi:hypothetical protein
MEMERKANNRFMCVFLYDIGYEEAKPPALCKIKYLVFRGSEPNQRAIRGAASWTKPQVIYPGCSSLQRWSG